jgi:hypothetical protein
LWNGNVRTLFENFAATSDGNFALFEDFEGVDQAGAKLLIGSR